MVRLSKKKEALLKCLLFGVYQILLTTIVTTEIITAIQNAVQKDFNLNLENNPSAILRIKALTNKLTKPKLIQLKGAVIK